MVGSVILVAADFDVVATGTHADVRLSSEAKEEFVKLQLGTHELAIRQFRELERFMDRFCSSLTPSFGPEQYKKEGEFSDGEQRKVAVYEFKPFKWRLYGAVLHVDGRKCFVGTNVDSAKKQNRADKKALKRAALIIGSVKEYREANGYD